MPQNRVGAPERVTVIGLGRFGTSVARTLHEIGHEVTAIDISERQIADAANYVTLAAQGDGTDEDLLKSLHVERSDVGIVAQGESLEASVLTTLLLKRLGVSWVVAKAKTALHGELLDRIGADQVIFPERDAGVRLAHSLAVRHINDYIPLSPTTGVAKLVAPELLVGHSLAALCGKQQARLNVLLIKRGQQIITVPHYEERVQAGDELIVVGPDIEIEAFVGKARTPEFIP